MTYRHFVTPLLGLALAAGVIATEPDITSRADDESNTTHVSAVGEAANPATSEDDGPRDRYFRTDTHTCNIATTADGIELITTLDTCPDGSREADIESAPCNDDEYELAELWVERLQDDGTYTAPEQVSGRECITPADLAAQARRAFAAMRITTPTATVQAREPLLVNVHYPAYATTQPQTQQATLLDVPVEIRADPVEYTWNFDDPHTPGGDTLTTTDPGRAWTQDNPSPDASWIGHTYTHLGDPAHDPDTHVDDQGDWYRDTVTVTLDTTWQGHFRIAGTSTWTTIDGTITTTSTTEPVTVTEARVRLHCDDLHGATTC